MKNDEDTWTAAFESISFYIFNSSTQRWSMSVHLDRREKTGFRFVPFACISFPLATKVWREDVDMVKTLLEAGVTSAAATAAVACTWSPYISLEVLISFAKCEGLQSRSCFFLWDSLSFFEMLLDGKESPCKRRTVNLHSCDACPVSSINHW